MFKASNTDFDITVGSKLFKDGKKYLIVSDRLKYGGNTRILTLLRLRDKRQPLIVKLRNIADGQIKQYFVCEF